jgi:hypothetical protein
VGLGILILVGLACGIAVAMIASPAYQSGCEFQAATGGLLAGFVMSLVAVVMLTLLSMYVTANGVEGSASKALGCAGVEILAVGAAVIGLIAGATFAPPC